MKSLCKILLALLPFAYGCDEPAGYDYGDYLVEFVTFEGERDGMPCFTFQSRDDSPEQTLLSESGLDKETHHIRCGAASIFFCHRDLAGYADRCRVALEERQLY